MNSNANILAVIFYLLTYYVTNTTGEIHGGTFLAMTGKDSVMIATDSRFSSPETGSLMLGEFTRPIIRVGSMALIGCFGLESDAHLLMKKLRKKLSVFRQVDLNPFALSRITSDILYTSGLYITPIIVCFDSKAPYICSMDSLGAQTISNTFAAIGTANRGLLSICESIYNSNLSPEELVSLAKTALTLALQRDVLSGCKMRILVLTRSGVIYEDFFSTPDA